MTVTATSAGPESIARSILRALNDIGVSSERLTELIADLPVEVDPDGFEHVVPVADFRANFKDMIDRVQEAPTLLTKRGRPIAAVVSADFYERAIAALEDVADAEAVSKARAEGGAPVPHDVVMSRR